MRFKKWYVMTATMLLFLSLLFINLFKEDIWDTNLKLLENKILSEEMIDKKGTLSEFTPFEWDQVFSFAPYTSKEAIYETIGYKWDNIRETVNEGMNQIVFMNNGEVVCYLYGYPENNKYRITFASKEYKDGVAVLNGEAVDKFIIRKNEDVIYLKQML